MSVSEKTISNLIQSQFPAFYNESGPTLIAFVQAYYEWMEQEGNPIYQARNLLEYNRIDSTVEEFLVHFSNTYLQGLQFASVAEKRLTVKKILDLYRAKGSLRALKLLFQLVFKEDIEVYLPATDILKPSDGVWNVPQYLEISNTSRNKEFVGKQITGFASKATGYVDRLVRKRISSKYVDLFFVTNTSENNFRVGELLTFDNDLSKPCPSVLGSLNSLLVSDGGAELEVGEIVSLTSDYGRGATARITEVEDTTGVVNFKLEPTVDNLGKLTGFADGGDGGWGFSKLYSNVFISNAVITYANVQLSGANAFLNKFVGVSFNRAPITLAGVAISNTTGGFTCTAANVAISDRVTITGTLGGTGTITGYTTGTEYKIDTVTGVAPSVTAFTLKTTANAAIVTTAGTPTGLTYTATLAPVTANAFLFTNTAMGIINLSDGITSRYNRIYTSTGNAQLVTVSSGNFANIEIGTVNSTETVFNYTDMVGGNNVSNTAYLSLALNSTAYGFPNYPFCNVSTGQLVDILNLQILEIGEIQNIIKTGGGIDYDTAPFVEIYQQGIATQNKQDHIINIVNVSKPYIVGEVITQNVTTTSAQQLNLIAPSAAFQVNEYVYQINSTPTGTYVANTQSNLLRANTGAPDFLTTFAKTLSGVAISNTTGGFTCTAADIAVSNRVTITGTLGGTGTITGYTTGAIYKISAITGTAPSVTGFTLTTTDNVAIVTTAGTPTGLTYIAASNDQKLVIKTGGVNSIRVINNVVNSTALYLNTNTATSNGESAVFIVKNEGIIVGLPTNTVINFINTTSSTWTNTANVYGLTSNSTSAIANVHGSIYATAIGKVKVANSTQLSVRRQSLQDFSANGDSIIGKSSGATSNASIVTIDTTSGFAGVNANVSANVVTANGTVSALSVVTSGYGYVEGEILQFTSTSNAQHVGSVRSTIGPKGTAAGFYSSTRGFLSEDKYIQDGNYYQTFSYEINSSIDVSKYYDMVKAVVHTAGTALHGKVIKKSTIETALDISNSGNGPIQA